MVALFCALVLNSNRRKSTMAALDEVSRHNLDLLERQRTFVQNASHELRTPITVALAHAELLPRPETDRQGSRGRGDRRRRAQQAAQARRPAAAARHGRAIRPPRPVPTRLAAVLDDTLSRWEPDTPALAARPARRRRPCSPTRTGWSSHWTRSWTTRSASPATATPSNCPSAGATGTPTSPIADSGPGIPGGQLDIGLRPLQHAGSRPGNRAQLRPRPLDRARDRRSTRGPGHRPRRPAGRCSRRHTAAAARSTGQPGPSLQPAAVPAEQ